MKGLIVVILFLVVFLIFLFSACDSPQDMNRPGDKMDGFIYFVDTNLTTTSGYYSVSIYNADYQDPFGAPPIMIDSLTITSNSGLYTGQFSFDGIPVGNYYVASTWSRYPKIPSEVPIVLGIYGCDTSHNCTNPSGVAYPNTQGNFRNIISWADTTKRIY